MQKLANEHESLANLVGICEEYKESRDLYLAAKAFYMLVHLDAYQLFKHLLLQKIASKMKIGKGVCQALNPRLT